MKRWPCSAAGARRVRTGARSNRLAEERVPPPPACAPAGVTRGGGPSRFAVGARRLRDEEEAGVGTRVALEPPTGVTPTLGIARDGIGSLAAPAGCVSTAHHPLYPAVEDGVCEDDVGGPAAEGRLLELFARRSGPVENAARRLGRTSERCDGFRGDPTRVNRKHPQRSGLAGHDDRLPRGLRAGLGLRA